MANKTFDRITKKMAFLLALCFLLSVTAVSVNAATFEQGNKFNDHGDKYGQGYKDGYSKGSNDGQKDCNQHGSREVLKKIPYPSNNDQSYRNGFKQSYITGYNEERYSCLKHKLGLTRLN